MKDENISCELHAVLRNTTKIGTAKHSICSFFSTGFISVIYRVKL